jgi:rhodanese-related sulfurtransferase
MGKRAHTLFVVLVLFALPKETHAIPPPDVITSIGSSFMQIFGLFIVFFSIGSSFILRALKKVRIFAKEREIATGIIATCVIVLSLAGAYAYTSLIQKETPGVPEDEIAKQVREEIEKRDTGEAVTTSAFFEENKELPLEITNNEFHIVESTAYVLDAREDEEYDIGFYPGSTHVRFADILAGAWSELPTDRVVYVFCWSGIRGSEVATFLREKGVLARVLEEGANGWVEGGGTWNGEIAFSHVYSAPRYAKLFTTEEVKEAREQGVMLVDARQQDGLANPIADSVFISAIYTPTDELNAMLIQVPVGMSVITVCDDFVSCFDAKIVGIKLEKQGGMFLGRYAAPWEY